MMAAYQPTPGVHPGMPHGHPGMAPNPGQHMGQPMQMHPGVSGAPHQGGAMMGMQPGGNGMPAGMGGQHPGAGMAMPAQMAGQSMAGGMPNAQAMSHMTTQQQIALQHHQAMQSNPQLAMQQHQMRLRQQAMMQQAHANGMMAQPGMQMNPQMAAQLQQHHQQQQQQQQQQGQAGVQGGGQQVQLTPHLQQQMMQQRMQQQAQQQQQQQAQMAQQLAMQHANSQQSNQGQPAPSNPQGQPANAAAAQQMRPQSRTANPGDQNQISQQHPQQSQAQQAQAQTVATTQPGQPANPQQQAAMSQQRQQQIAMLQRQQAIQTRQHMAQQAAQFQQQQGQGNGGMFILRLMNFSDHLSNFGTNSESPAFNGKNITHWHNFVEKHFAPEGRLLHGFDNTDSNSRQRTFEVLRPNVARYFYTYFDSGASSIRLHTEHVREMPHASGGHQITCQRAVFSISYPNGARLEMSGSLTVLFAAGTDAIEIFSFQTSGTEEIVSRDQIEKVLTNFSPTMSNKTSPKMTKNKLPKAQQKLQEAESRITIDHFPKTPKGTMGFTSKVQHFLEIGETMNIMSDLMHAAQEKKMRPEHALEALVAEYESQPNGQPGNPQINLPPNGVRTPSMANMQMPQGGQFSSPNVSHMNLPMNGSPHLGNNPGNLAPGVGMANSHTPSPHQSNMSAPMMVPQHSQQGTNSSVASENTSPNLNNNNKRRRSTVKLEGDEPENNANRVKPSPRMSKKPKP